METTTKTVAVLGGHGFIGSEVVRRLSISNRVRLVDRGRRHSPPDHRDARGVERVISDLSDLRAVERAIGDSDAVVYAVSATLPAESTANPLLDVTTTLSPLLTVLEHLRHRPHVRFVFLSSGGAIYGNPRTLPVRETHPAAPISSYGVLKLTAEHYIRMYSTLYGLDARILRVANAYGPGQQVGRSQGLIANIVDAILRGRPVRVFGDGRAVRDYVHVRDVADGVRAAVCADGPPVMNVATGIGTPILGLLDILQEISGRRAGLELLPARPFDVEAIVLDGSAFLAMIGHEPTPLTDGLEEIWRLATARR